MFKAINFDDFAGTIEEFLEKVDLLKSRRFPGYVDLMVRKHFQDQFDRGGMDSRGNSYGYWHENDGEYAKWKEETVGHNRPGILSGDMEAAIQGASLSIEGDEAGVVFVWEWFSDTPVMVAPPQSGLDESRPYGDYMTYYQDIEPDSHRYKVFIGEQFMVDMIEEIFNETALA